jgi:hypothetical protein
MGAMNKESEKRLVEQAAQELAAGFLRCIAGVGNHDLFGLAHDLVKRSDAYEGVHGEGIALGPILDIYRVPPETKVEKAERRLVEAALRMVAGRIVQRGSRGSDALHEAVRQYNEANTEERAIPHGD